MRTAALPTFRKLYGRIETDIMANDQLTVVIQNNYNTYSFGGSKALVLSTTSWIGGKNNFIGVAYLTIGGLCIFLAVGFVVLLYMVKPRYAMLLLPCWYNVLATISYAHMHVLRITSLAHDPFMGSLLFCYFHVFLPDYVWRASSLC